MLNKMKEDVCNANKLLKEYNLITFTWGNVSMIDRENNLVIIKPSGVEYDDLEPDKMVVIDFDGEIIEGNLKPSSDTKTHLELYKHFENINAVVHTHSPYATSFAQANKDITAYGTTHADYMYGDIPCTRRMTTEEINSDYEKETGSVIVETFINRNINPLNMPAVIVANHGPFTWGKDVFEAVYNSVVLEEVAKIAIFTEQINKEAYPIQQVLLDKHYLRKHGVKAYYGQ